MTGQFPKHPWSNLWLVWTFRRLWLTFVLTRLPSLLGIFKDLNQGPFENIDSFFQIKKLESFGGIKIFLLLCICTTLWYLNSAGLAPVGLVASAWGWWSTLCCRPGAWFCNASPRYPFPPGKLARKGRNFLFIHKGKTKKLLQNEINVTV